MSTVKRDPEVVAVETIHAALKSLDEATRAKVLASVRALLGMQETAVGQTAAVSSRQLVGQVQTSPASRPPGLTEIIKEKSPKTNAQLITLFAYYREKFENLPRFSREDFKPYFGKAHKPPPGNYDRDFVKALSEGWLHEDAADSYITTKGIEAVESGFSLVGSPRKKSKPSRSKRNSKR